MFIKFIFVISTSFSYKNAIKSNGLIKLRYIKTIHTKCNKWMFGKNMDWHVCHNIVQVGLCVDET